MSARRHSHNTIAQCLPPIEPSAPPGAPHGSKANTDTNPALRLAAATLPDADEAACPVAALATRAATIVKAHYALQDRIREPEPMPPFAIPDLRDIASSVTGPRPDVISGRLNEELEAIVTFAAFELATSKKGALFQMYLAAHEASRLEGELREGAMPTEEWRAIENIHYRTKRLAYSSLCVFDNEEDDDLKLLRCWFFNREWEEEINGRKVIAELNRRYAV